MVADPDLGQLLGGRPVARRAALRAAEAHRGQVREVDGAPFVVHSLEVAFLLLQAGYGDEVVAAALLHDVIEKTPITIRELRAEFGGTVAEAVAALTEDETVADYPERKRRLREQVAAAGVDTIAIFAADKLVKARELRVAAEGDRVGAREVACKHEHYADCLALAERRLPDHPFTDALRFELATQPLVPALRWLPPLASPPLPTM